MITRADLEAMDANDPLAPYCALFTLPEGVVYLDGNSLGAMPSATAPRLASMITEEWGNGLIRSWNDTDWIDAPSRIGNKIAKIIGAPDNTVIAADSTSVNLFKLLGVALALRPGRRTILTERGNFPTDIYIAEGLAVLLDRGHRIKLVAPEAILDAIDNDTAVVMLTHVNYQTGTMFDMATVTRGVQRAGALMLWDLAHSAGAVPLDVAACNVDLAVGCGYKFLNGGPGAPAFLHVAERLQADARFPLTGWLGHAAPFAFEASYRPAPGLARAVVGTPPMLSMAALEVGVDIALRVSIDELREKSLRQTDLFATLVAEQCTGHGLALSSPTDPTRRGSQVCFTHTDAYPIMQALIARGVIGDFRAPDVLRFGITPLYLGYAELWDAVQILQNVMTTHAYTEPKFQARRKVT